MRPNLKALLTIILLTLSVTLNACTRSTPSPTSTPMIIPITSPESFEAGLNDWEIGSDVPDDPDRPGQSVLWSIEISKEQVAEGETSARFFLDGKQDDGTIWLARPFNVPANKDFTVNLSFEVWSETESSNTLAKVAAYAGTRRPVGEGDFNLEQPANQVAGWKQYTYSVNARSDETGQLWVALGISVIWETEVTYYFDDVLVEINTATTTSVIPTTPPTVAPLAPSRQIVLEAPQGGATISSPVGVHGRVSVAPFESTLVCTIYDAQGQAISKEPIQVDAEMGQPGTFAASIPFTVSSSGPGKLEVAEISPKDGSVVVSITVDVVLATGQGEGTIEPHPGWQVYTNRDFQITLQYPAAWRQVSGYDERYGGPDGFFQLSAMSGQGWTLYQVCDSHARHKLQPYGSQPQIERVEVQSQEACLILPSSDQTTDMQGQAALIVRYPQPVQIRGEVYHYFILWADGEHIRDIGDTLRFTVPH